MEIRDQIKLNIELADYLIASGIDAPDEIRHKIGNRYHRIDSVIELRDFLSRHIGTGDRVLMLVDAEHEDPEIGKVIDDHYEMAHIGERTLFETSETICENMIDNIANPNHPWVTDYDRPLEAIPAFIIYSGPSLDRNIHLLYDCKKYGVLISTNTPVKACMKYDAGPDLVVCLENRPVHDKIDGYPIEFYVTDMSCHPKNVNVGCSRHAAMFQPDLAFLKYALKFGTIPIGNGGGVSTSAVSLAYYWGANPIILVGFDLALTNDRTCTMHIGSDTILRYEGGCAISEGSHPGSACSHYTEISAWGGGTVKTTYERIMYLQWLESFARKAGFLTMINATEGGAHIDGWKEITLDSALRTLKEIEKPNRKLMEQHFETHATKRRSRRLNISNKIIKNMMRSYRDIIKISRKKGIDSDIAIRRIAREEPLIHCLLAPRFMKLMKSRPSQKDRIAGIRRIVVESAERMLEIIEAKR